MRDKLIELLKQKSCVYAPCDNECGGCKNVEMYDDSIESIADHLLAEGVVVLPVRVGQTVFVICNTVERIKLKIETCIYETKIDHISIGARGAEFHLLYRCITHPDCDWIVEKDIGKTVFLTRSEAEQALAERR